MSSKLQMHPGRVNSLEVKSFPSDPTLIGSPGNCRLRGLFSEVKRATKWDLNSYKLGHMKNFWTSAASGCSRGSGETFTGDSQRVVVELWCVICCGALVCFCWRYVGFGGHQWTKCLVPIFWGMYRKIHIHTLQIVTWHHLGLTGLFEGSNQFGAIVIISLEVLGHYFW